MVACVGDPRIDRIARCTDELERCRKPSKVGGLGGNILGEMDWLTELHRLIFDWEGE